MERAFTLVEPRLDWGAVVRGHWLVWLGVLNILCNVMLGAWDLRLLLVTLQARRRSSSAWRLASVEGFLREDGGESGLVERNRIQVSFPTNSAKQLMLFFGEGQLRDKGFVFRCGECEDLQ
ncbi:unnamed protein product [Prunus brigantina]